MPRSLTTPPLTTAPPQGRATPTAIERFVADCLHEFRTPLTAIHGFASLVRDGLGGPVTDKQEDYLGKTLQAVRVLERQFEEFRAAVSLRLEGPRTAPEHCDLSAVVAEALLEMREEGARVVSSVPEGALVAWSDFGELAQALRCVLQFAVKRSGPADVRVAGEITSGRPTLVVECGGPLPTAGDCELVQQGESQQGDHAKSVTRVFGIGLELARNLLARNGGRLELRAGQDGKTLLRMELPRRSESETEDEENWELRLLPED